MSDLEEKIWEWHRLCGLRLNFLREEYNLSEIIQRLDKKYKYSQVKDLDRRLRGLILNSFRGKTKSQVKSELQQNSPQQLLDQRGTGYKTIQKLYEWAGLKPPKELTNNKWKYNPYTGEKIL